jgi:hypothetical protein
MPTLRDIQRDIARSILSNDGVALVRIADDGFAAAARLNIYRNNVAITLIAALRLAYPAVDKLVGSDFFDGVARAFIAQHPPRTACLSDYGGEFPDFLAALPAAAALAYLPDVASVVFRRGARRHRAGAGQRTLRRPACRPSRPWPLCRLDDAPVGSRRRNTD